jgi:hypothetical protein
MKRDATVVIIPCGAGPAAVQLRRRGAVLPEPGRQASGPSAEALAAAPLAEGPHPQAIRKVTVIGINPQLDPAALESVIRLRKRRRQGSKDANADDRR